MNGFLLFEILQIIASFCDVEVGIHCALRTMYELVLDGGKTFSHTP